MGMLFQSQQGRGSRKVFCSASDVHHTKSDTHLYKSLKLSAAGSWSTEWLAHREALQSSTQRANLPCAGVIEGHQRSPVADDNNTEGPEMPGCLLFSENEWVHQDLEHAVRGCLTFTTNVQYVLIWPGSLSFPWRVVKLSVSHNF